MNVKWATQKFSVRVVGCHHSTMHRAVLQCYGLVLRTLYHSILYHSAGEGQINAPSTFCTNAYRVDIWVSSRSDIVLYAL